MTHLRLYQIVGALALAALLLSGAVAADEIKETTGLLHKGIRIISMREGQVRVLTPNGERLIPLSRIASLKLDKYPQLTAADEAMAKNDYPKAAVQLMALKNIATPVRSVPTFRSITTLRLISLAAAASFRSRTFCA